MDGQYKRNLVHGIHFDHVKLDRLLFQFMGGQFQIQYSYPKNPDFEVYRGEVISSRTWRRSLPHSGFLKERLVRVRLSWMCRRHVISGPYTNTRAAWRLLPHPPADHYITFVYTSYYEQPDENRVKIEGVDMYGSAVIVHFYHVDDHTNLVWNETGFIPYYTNERGIALKSVMLALLFRKKYRIQKPTPKQ
jgi:hypothetical protein